MQQTAGQTAGANAPTSTSACASLPDRWASSAQDEALVSPSRHLVAFCDVARKAADVGHEDARFAGDVDAQIPGAASVAQRAAGKLGHVRTPRILGRRAGLD